MIIDYIICAQESYVALQNEVCRAIKGGWQPIGCISSSADKYSFYAQAMVKYAPEEPSEAIDLEDLVHRIVEKTKKRDVTPEKISQFISRD